jgi:hypothetical protein
LVRWVGRARRSSGVPGRVLEVPEGLRREGRFEAAGSHHAEPSDLHLSMLAHRGVGMDQANAAGSRRDVGGSRQAINIPHADC